MSAATAARRASGGGDPAPVSTWSEGAETPPEMISSGASAPNSGLALMAAMLISTCLTDVRGLRRVDRSQPPTADQEPQREQQLTEECEHRDGGELQGEDGAHGVEGVAGPGDDEQRTDDLGDEVGPE